MKCHLSTDKDKKKIKTKGLLKLIFIEMKRNGEVCFVEWVSESAS